MDEQKKTRGLPYWMNREFFIMLISAGSVALSIVAIVLES
jgi:hypothetical protein